MATATKNRKASTAPPKGKKAHKSKVLAAGEKQALNRQAEGALETALSDVLCGWRTVGSAWAVIRSNLEDWKPGAIEHYYRENFDEFLDASGWDEEEIFEEWQDEDGNVSDEDREGAIEDAVAAFVGEMAPEAMDELLNELAEHDNRELIAA